MRIKIITRRVPFQPVSFFGNCSQFQSPPRQWVLQPRDTSFLGPEDPSHCSPQHAAQD